VRSKSTFDAPQIISWIASTIEMVGLSTEIGAAKGICVWNGAISEEKSINQQA
jgi:hypothetical protein